MKKNIKEKDLLEIKIKTLRNRSPRFLKMQTDKVLLSNAKTSIREFIRHPGAVLIIPELKKNELLFVKQFRYPLSRVFLEFPAGKIDAGESSRQTARRELREEVGYEAKHLHFITSIHPVIGYADEVIHLFLAQDLIYVGESPDEGEFLIPQKLTFKAALGKVKNHKITDVKTQIALFWYEKITKGLWSLK